MQFKKFANIALRCACLPNGANIAVLPYYYCVSVVMRTSCIVIVNNMHQLAY